MSLDYNPTTGLPMLNENIDVAGKAIGETLGNESSSLHTNFSNRNIRNVNEKSDSDSEENVAEIGEIKEKGFFRKLFERCFKF